MRAQVGKFTLSGDGLCVGFDSADPVSRSHPGFPFTGGGILGVGVDVGEKAYSIWRGRRPRRSRPTEARGAEPRGYGGPVSSRLPGRSSSACG